MSRYKRVLVAVDLTDEAHEVAEKAAMICSDNNAQLHIVHAIEPLSFAYGGDIPMDFTGIQAEIQKQAELKLAATAQKYGIKEEHQFLVIGRPETEIHNLTKEHNIDLVVIGSHGRHGLGLLLGSTANGVLHGSQCDVLAVRVGQ